MGQYGSAPSGAASIVTETVLQFNSAAVNPGTSVDTTVALPLSNVSDSVIVTPQQPLTAGLIMQGRISSDGVLTVRVINATAATIDPAAVDLTVGLIKKAPGGG